MFPESPGPHTEGWWTLPLCQTIDACQMGAWRGASLLREGLTCVGFLMLFPGAPLLLPLQETKEENHQI